MDGIRNELHISTILVNFMTWKKTIKKWIAYVNDFRKFHDLEKDY